MRKLFLVITFLLFSSTAVAYDLPDTGQTGDYTSVFGEDSDYTINPPSYTDNGDGTITDNNTGTMWQKTDDSVGRNWTDAVIYCENLSLAGHTDWRIPEIGELIGIINYGMWNPAIDTSYFPFNSINSSYWSSTFPSSTNIVWTIDNGNGSTNDLGGGSAGSTYIYVRCVRGNGAIGSFTDNGNGTVSDSKTNLMWQQDRGGQQDWESAISYCENLSLADHVDWKLPNVKELESIVDYTKESPSIDTNFFPNTAGDLYFWTSTTFEFYNPEAWYVHFEKGKVHLTPKTSSRDCRCVRIRLIQDISVSPTSYDFGTVVVGDSSTPQIFTISNTGDADLDIGTISLTGTDVTEFTIQNDNCTGQTILPLGNCTIDVVFSPTAEGVKSANLSVPSNDPDTPVLNVPLSGESGNVVIDSVWTSNLNGIPKIIFYRGDYIRYNVDFTFTGNPSQKYKIVASGKAKVRTGTFWETILTKKRKFSGSYTLSWDEVVPITADSGSKGKVNIKVRVRGIGRDKWKTTFRIK